MDEIIENENGYYKGANFEIAFADFMKTDLGWHNSKTRVQLKGKANSKGANVDVVGIKTDSRYGFYSNFGRILLAGSIGCASVAAIYLIMEVEYDIIWLFVSIAIPLLVISIFLLFYREQFCDKHAWGECKNLKGKATYTQVQKLLHEYNDYVATGDKEFKFIKKYFVSANGFVENAHKLAMDNHIECYELKNGKFELSKYWQ